MHIKKLSAYGYRNLHITDLELSAGINIFYGNNAQGKTNCLEAVYYCAFGRSLRAKYDSEIICWGENQAGISVDFVKNQDQARSIGIALDLCSKNVTKRISVDKIPIRHMKDLFGLLTFVMFSQEDL